MSDELQAWLKQARHKLDEAAECGKEPGRNASSEARWRRASWAVKYGDELLRKCEALAEALESIRQYGADTLSGRTDGPDDREWQRAAVAEMTARAESALRAPGGGEG